MEGSAYYMYVHYEPSCFGRVLSQASCGNGLNANIYSSALHLNGNVIWTKLYISYIKRIYMFLVSIYIKECQS